MRVHRRVGGRLTTASALGLLTLISLLSGGSLASALAPGPWVSPASNLSTPGLDAGDPQLAVAPDGATTAVWYSSSGSNIVQAATRPPGGSFGTPVDLSAAGEDAHDPQIAVSPDGTTTVTWRRYNGGNYIVQAATRPPGGSFGAPFDLSAPGKNAFDPQIAVSPDGTTTAVWRRDDGSNYIIQAVISPPGGSFGVPVDLSAIGRNAYSPQIAISPDGTTTAVWRRYNGSDYITQAATRPAGGSFGTPVDLSAPGEDAFDQQLVAAPDGASTVVWRRYNGSNYVVQATIRPAGGSFGTPVDLSAAGQNAFYPQVAAFPDGTTTAVWHRDNGGNYVVQATIRPPGGNFGMPVDLSAAGQDAEDPQVVAAPDETGIITAVWQRDDGSNDSIQAASTVTPSLLLAVARTGSGQGAVASDVGGINCGVVCAVNLAAYTKVALTATAKPGSTFTGWGGVCSGTEPTCTMTMNQARNVTAKFSKILQPTDTTAIFDGTRLHIRLKCGPQYRPKCVMSAVPVTRQGRKGKPMAKPVKKKIKAGKWIKVSFLITPKYRATLTAMSKKAGKTVFVQQKIRSKKIGKKKFKGKKPRTVYHRYRVRST
ncbi:MAG: hypothetical protein M9938_03605 [Solirubrobacterales bacterium]|nr:hypothetical protein [Solirubrobacterales bacterium]